VSRVSIIILNWNGAPDALACLASVRVSSYRDYSYLLVDNGSTDGSAAILEKAVLPQHILRLGRNGGYTGGMNQGIAAWMNTDAPFGLLLTQDVRLERTTLAVLVDALVRNPALGIVGPVLVNRQNGAVHSAGGYIRRGGVHIMHAGPEASANLGPQAPANAVEEVQWVDGCCLLIRRQVIDAVGGFDERYFMYLEEVDLCRRASLAGWGIGVARSARASQIPGATSSGRFRDYYLCRNKIFFCRKHFGARAALRAAASHLYWGFPPLALLNARRNEAEVRASSFAGLTGIVHGILGRGGQMPGWLARRASTRAA
jgi:GT2 family glycosyltransferase